MPFGKQTPPARSSLLFGVMMLYTVGLAVGVGIQYLLFRSVAAVVVATLVAGLGAYFVTRLTLTGFAVPHAGQPPPRRPGVAVQRGAGTMPPSGASRSNLRTRTWV